MDNMTTTQTLAPFTTDEVAAYDAAVAAFDAQHGQNTVATSLSPITFCALSPARQAEVRTLIDADKSRRFEVLHRVYRAIEIVRTTPSNV